MINGNGRGSKVTDLSTMDINKLSNNQTDLFLDHVTGDLYIFSPESEEWVPSSNVGLHYKRAAMEYNTIGKYIIKSPVYQPKRLNAENVVLENHEVVCIVKKHMCGHWLFQGCEPDFIVPCGSRWQVHPIVFVDKNKVFKELASSADGTMIIEYKNIIGVQFEVKKRYPNTVNILKNFVRSKLRTLVEDSEVFSVYDYKNLEFKQLATNGITFKPKGPLESQRSSPRHHRAYKMISDKSTPTLHKGNSLDRVLDSNIIYACDDDIFKHSGYASKQKGPMIVSRNNIAATRIRVDRNAMKESLIVGQIQSLRKKMKGGEAIRREEKNVQGNNLDSVTRGLYTKYRNSSLPVSANESQHLFVEDPVVSSSILVKDSKLSGNTSCASMNKSEIRRFLYPQLDEEYVRDQTAWVEIKLEKGVYLLIFIHGIRCLGVFPRKREIRVRK